MKKTTFDFNQDIECEEFTFRHGLYHFRSKDEVRESEFGYSISMNHVDSTIMVYLEDFDEAVQTCLDHYERFEKIKEIAKETIKYLSSPEGAWGRSGT